VGTLALGKHPVSTPLDDSFLFLCMDESKCTLIVFFFVPFYFVSVFKIRRLQKTLGKVVVKGPPNNIPMLAAFIQTPLFAQGKTYTNTLSKFTFSPRCVEVVGAGLSVTVQDYPGRTRRGLWRVGVPPSGPMDHLSARLANALVGNPEENAVLEVTVKGPSLKFHVDAVCAVCGASFDVTVNGAKAPMFTSFPLKAGDIVKVDMLASPCGARAYVAVAGGFDVPQYLGSRSTFVKGGFGGTCRSRSCPI
jgi:urea carboxylase